jgi:hypothetical protein
MDLITLALAKKYTDSNVISGGVTTEMLNNAITNEANVRQGQINELDGQIEQINTDLGTFAKTENVVPLIIVSKWAEENGEPLNIDTVLTPCEIYVDDPQNLISDGEWNDLVHWTCGVWVKVIEKQTRNNPRQVREDAEIAGAFIKA